MRHGPVSRRFGFGFDVGAGARRLGPGAHQARADAARDWVDLTFVSLHAIEPTRPRGQRRVDGVESPRQRADTVI